jgi:hypothetical protein
MSDQFRIKPVGHAMWKVERKWWLFWCTEGNPGHGGFTIPHLFTSIEEAKRYIDGILGDEAAARGPVIEYPR